MRKGYTITEKGYVRVTAGPDRHQYGHRVKARECMKASGKILTNDMEVHHLCNDKTCDQDFHLLILPGVMHDFFIKNGNGNGHHRHYYKRKRYKK